MAPEDTPEVEDRTSHDPFAPLARPEPAPSFPEDRLRRAGMTDEALAEARAEWDEWTAEQQAESLEALTAVSDDELAEQVRLAAEDDEPDDGLTDDERQAKAADAARVQAEVDAWALGAVEAGDYENVEAAVAALATLQPSEGSSEDESARSGDSGALVGDGTAGACLLCAELPAETVAALPEHPPAQHAGQSVLDRPVEFMAEQPATAAEFGTVEWWNAAGYAVLAQHDDEGQVAILDPSTQQVAPGGPGEAVEASADGAPTAGADPSAVGVRDEGQARLDALSADARQRLDRGATVEDMLEWVGGDPDRAGVVLDLERAGKARKTLVEPLEALRPEPEPEPGG